MDIFTNLRTKQSIANQFKIVMKLGEKTHLRESGYLEGNSRKNGGLRRKLRPVNVAYFRNRKCFAFHTRRSHKSGSMQGTSIAALEMRSW
jgi:hypothetical protein